MLILLIEKGKDNERKEQLILRKRVEPRMNSSLERLGSSFFIGVPLEKQEDGRMENKLTIYNTLTKKEELFVPNQDGKVAMYTCGPTVYHFAHIGNLRSYIMEDLLEKTLRYLKYDVKRVMNITDVGHLSSDADTGEDKMLKGAKREHKTVMEIAKFYTDAFFEDCKKLNIKRPDVVEPATNCIAEFIHMVSALLEKGFAYEMGGNIYFDTSKLENYHVFSGQTEEELLVGVRDDVEEDTNKKNKSDFVLWFTKSKFDDQELKWESPWGVGYPGWHIECSCISMKHLGEYMDIHCGGVDNIFPHHTNEIAQSEAYLGHKWCNYWFHVHHLNDKTGKMSKSKGDFLTVSLLESKGYNPLVYRMFCLQSHYRKPLEFSYEVLDNMTSAYNKLVKRIADLSDAGELEQDKFDAYKARFEEALCNDLNSAMGITVLYEMLKADMSDKTKRELVKSFDEVLSLDLCAAPVAAEVVDAELEQYVLAKIEERKAAKKEKDFAKADAIRAELLEKGIVLEDTREGVKWKKA